MKHGETLKRLKRGLVSGHVYRRCELAKKSSNIDRNLVSLVESGSLKKIARGLYLSPKDTSFGEAPPNEQSLLHSFLKDENFVVYSPNQFNTLGFGTTQLYNRRVVFNIKRHGELKVGGRTYNFHRWRSAPKKLDEEFMVVQLLNSLNELAEDREKVLTHLGNKLAEFDRKRLKRYAKQYGTNSCINKLSTLFDRSNNGSNSRHPTTSN